MTEVKREFKESDAEMQKRFDAAQAEADAIARQLVGDGILLEVSVEGGTPQIDNARGVVDVHFAAGCSFWGVSGVHGCWILPQLGQTRPHGYYFTGNAIQVRLPPDEVTREDASNLKGGWFTTTLFIAIRPGLRASFCGRPQPQSVAPDTETMVTSMLFEFQLHGARLTLDDGRAFELQSMYY